MSDHNFSNQKSALEEYFVSLLADEETDPADNQDLTATDAAQTDYSDVYTEAYNEFYKDEIIDDVIEEEDVTEEIDSPIVEIIPPAKSPVIENKPEVIEIKPPSIEDMLANVEVATAEEQPTIDFAEPELAPEIVIPLPEVAPVTEVKEEVIVEDKVEVVAEEVATETIQQEVAPSPVAEPIRVEAEIPEWAEGPFQCLKFQVGGLSLVVPLVKLNGVIPWTDKVVETPNQTDWYLGVLMNHGNKVEVIDTAVMVLPEEHRVDMPEELEDRLSHILLVDDQKWGLACDSIGDVVWLKQSDVKWRSNKSKRPWLLGTAIEQMCAVVDTTAFADMIKSKK